MLSRSTLIGTCKNSIRKYSSSIFQRLAVTPDEKVLKEIAEEKYKFRKHPGIMKHKTVKLPDAFVTATENVLADYPIKSVLQCGYNLSRHLNGKQPPIEDEDLYSTINKAQEKVLQKSQDIVIKCEEDERRFQQVVKDKVNNVLRKKVYNWAPIKYDVFKSLAYLLVRAPAEYAVLMKIFSEIYERDRSFVPKSLFDFGSGVGTVTWAANAFWKNTIFEYYNVDMSAEMNDLAQILLQGGRGGGTSMTKGTFYRQFLPASHMGYDIVTSAYTLMELPSLETRLETVLNLWNKTQNYLVIVEQGTNAGFKIVNEIRDFILQIDKENHVGHVFSPCPHEKPCPRFLANDGTPCNFEVQYQTIPVGQKLNIHRERYSYIVLKKGKRSEENVWPRVVRPTLQRSKHAICRVCANNGQLGEVVFTAKKNGKMTYYCARVAEWGDLLPVTVNKEASNDFSKCDTDSESIDQEK